MERHKKKRCPPQRCSFFILSLLVTYGIFYDADYKFRVFRIKVISPAFIVFHKSLTCFDPILIRNPLAGNTVPGIIKNNIPVLIFTHLISPELYPVRCFSSAQVLSALICLQPFWSQPKTFSISISSFLRFSSAI